MVDAVEAFFDSFLEKFNANQIEALHKLYDEPVVWIQPIGTRVFPERAEFAKQMESLRLLYAQNGMAATRKRVLQVTNYGVGLHMADLAWSHFRSDGQLLAEIKTTYILREVEDGFLISAHISHNEMFQRPLGGGVGTPE
ncbi:MAG: hypothetical protein AAGB10_20055 [Pseudomonadota bacterium]